MAKRKSIDEAIGHTSKMFKDDDEIETISRLKNFVNEHKLTPQNAWHNNFIDDFHKMTLAQTLNLHQMAQFLEMAGKIYSLRVNMLFDDVTRTNVTLKEVKLTNEKKPTEKPRCQKKIKSVTVVKNTTILNLRITNLSPPFNPCFRRILQTPGNRSSDMLSNQLSSKSGSLVVPSLNTMFWDSNDYQQRICNEDLGVTIRRIALKRHSDLRSSLKDYKISEEPLEKYFAVQTISLDSDDEEMPAENNFNSPSAISSRETQDSGFNDDFTASDKDLNQSDNDNDKSNFTHFDSIFSDDVEMRDESERMQSQESPEDLSMMPTSNEEFTYSYKSMDTIRNFWAGPSYWKFYEQKDETKLNASRVNNTIRNKISNEITLESMTQMNDELETRTNIDRFRGFRNQLTLPSDYQIDSEIFNNFSISSHFKVHSETIDNILHSTAIYDDNDDENLQLFNDTTTSESNNDKEEDFHKQSLVLPSFQSYLNVRKRVTNMKLIKDTCLSIVKSEACINSSNSGVKFSEMAKKSSKLLLEKNENTSTAVIFQAILHLTSEGKVTINSKNNMDFKIQ